MKIKLYFLKNIYDSIICLFGVDSNHTGMKNCESCIENTLRGWCNDDGLTGLGECMEGSSLGPATDRNSSDLSNNTICTDEQWYFTSCPRFYCKQCMAGYYGDPVNGGNCKPCLCNNHGDLGYSKSDTCYCKTNGLNEPYCERCDDIHTYVGNPEKENGFCYYNLSINSLYTFNLSKPEDYHYININFMTIPVKLDVDLNFTILCSGSALVNVSVGSTSTSEKYLNENHKCGNFNVIFSHGDQLYGADNFTFHVYIYNFNTPCVLQILFSPQMKFQPTIISTLKIVGIYFTIYLILIICIVLAVFHIVQKYSTRRANRMRIEDDPPHDLEYEPTSAPTPPPLPILPHANVIVEFNQPPTLLDNQNEHQKAFPTPIVQLPYDGDKTAVMSFIVQFPCGDGEMAQEYQSGICLATTIVPLENADAIQETSV